MNHKQKEFEFIKKNVKTKNVEMLNAITKPYSFEIEEIIVNRFGRDALDAVTAGKHFETDFTIEDVKEDMPKLFATNLQNVDYKKTPIDTFVEVYHFFLGYKRNAWMRQLISEKETGHLLLKQIQQILSSIPEASLKGKN